MNNSMKKQIISGTIYAGMLAMAIGGSPLHAANPCGARNPCAAKNPCKAKSHW